MINNIRGRYAFGDLHLFVDNKLLDPKPSQKIINHSPDGFGAGYLGSAAAQSALAILLEVVGKEKAERYHQAFKEEFLAEEIYQTTNFDININIKAWVKAQEAHRGT